MFGQQVFLGYHAGSVLLRDTCQAGCMLGVLVVVCMHGSANAPSEADAELDLAIVGVSAGSLL